MARLSSIFLALSALVTVLSASFVIHPYPKDLDFQDPVLLSAQQDNDEELNYRLSGDVIPSRYEIQITPNLDEWTYEGLVTIHVHATKENVREITLHSNDLTIQTVNVYDEMANDLHVGEEYTYENATHKLSIATNADLELDKLYYLQIKFSGNMKDDMSGFYRSTYMMNGVERRLGATQFQTTSSRRAIPCFDEPQYKAIFDLMILRPENYHSLSNAKKLLEGIPQMDTGLLMDLYESTPPMSVYLLAFIVSDHAMRGDDQFQVWARPDMYDNTEYAYEVGTKLLDYFNEYTDYNYYTHIGKLDMAAVPDSRSGNSIDEA